MAGKDKNWFAKHKVLTVIGVIIILAIIGSVAGGGSNSGTNTASNDQKTSDGSKTAATAKIGQAVRDGKFEFTVTDFKCGAKTVGTNEFTREEAQGEFCIMSVTVKNIGDESQTFASSDQKVLNKNGQEYSSDTSAELAVQTSDVWLNEINPGNTAKGKLVFDVPKNSDITTAVLHDSAFSDGIKVNL